MFRQVATSALSWSVVSNWKLDSSRTYSSTSSLSRSSAGVPRLPPTATFLPAAAAISPTKVVTVLLALEPVMAMIGALAKRANRSMSPESLTPRLTAACSAGVAMARPGLTSNSLARQRKSTSSSPQRTSTCGNCSRKVASSGGLARVSTPAKAKPWRARKRTRVRSEEVHVQLATTHVHLRELFSQGGQLRRVGTGIDHGESQALAREKTHQGQIG